MKKRERLRAIIGHITITIFTISMSSLFPEFVGNYSVHSADVTNMHTVNTKRRLPTTLLRPNLRDQ